MPIWLRKFTFFKIQEYYEEASKAEGKPTGEFKPKKPAIKPDYSTSIKK